jgi:hypothetical protein
MTRTPLYLLLSAGLVAGCGDSNSGDTGSASATEGSSDATNSTTSPTNATTNATTEPTSTSPTSGNSDSASTTGDPGTTTEGSTGADETTGNVDPSTTSTTGPDTTTGVVDTTDGSTGGEDTTTGEMKECPLAEAHLPCDPGSDDALHAIGLNCTTAGNKWIDNDNAVKVAKLSFQAPPPMDGKRSWQVAKSYGTYIDPNTQKPFWSSREGDKVLLISSGLLPAPNNQGVVIVEDSDVYNDSGNGGQWDSDVMPPPMSPEHGSPDPMGYTNCDGKNDCSNTILDQWDLGGGDAEDKMWFSFELTAPAIANGQSSDAKGYSFDFAYFSAEFPEFVDSSFNDIFVVWQASEDYTGNVTFINGQPLTVTALWPIDFQGECDFLDPNCVGEDPHLEGTGYIFDGGATGWYQATGGVKPGETFLLAFGIFDMGDSTYDTTAIIDNWQWDCEGCVPNEVDSCGVIPM